ncbi:TolB family protein [Streptomyces sp. NPDC087300]|uniref:TolB family protein n=1 Tax=Streptomyces sp. NPDC087300 TaxID=3365780 RepID=UPI003822C563
MDGAMRGRGSTAVLAAAVAVALTGGAATAQAKPHGPRTERVSTTSAGAQLDGYSHQGVLSDDGRYAAFYSKAVEFRCHQNVYTCLQMKDRVTGEVTAVPDASGFSWAPPVLSGDGRRVGFTAGTKVPVPEVYDRATGTSQRVLPESDGEAWTGELWSVSRDGGQVAYGAGSRPRPTQRLYVRDMATGVNDLISGEAEGDKEFASLSADGTVVAYQLAKSGDDPSDVLVRNRTTGETVHADKGLGKGTLVQLGEDGRQVVFVADGGTYVRDLRTDRTRHLADTPAVSASRDGRYAVLTAAEGNSLTLLDLRTGARTPVGPGDAVPGAVTAKGREVAFTSTATDLVADDTNGDSDVFVRHTR